MNIFYAMTFKLVSLHVKQHTIDMKERKSHVRFVYSHRLNQTVISNDSFQSLFTQNEFRWRHCHLWLLFQRIEKTCEQTNDGSLFENKMKQIIFTSSLRLSVFAWDTKWIWPPSYEFVRDCFEANGVLWTRHILRKKKILSPWN